MELTPQIIDNPILMQAWVQGRQRIMFDNDRDAAARVEAGRELVLVLAATLDGPAGVSVGEWPRSLPPMAREKWQIAFSDDGDDLARVGAVEYVYGVLHGAHLTAAGAELLKRELGD